ncbi:MAG TPA: preprotein translocase subunit SecG, partial [Verrucomicrobiae bacterium]|nr:preprotein translocase subunit SecG [Verrucomicrobiae bacterium]
MTILIIFLTVVLVLDCLLLGLLIMIQLPKKEAGIGMAFGGGAADALFGAGSGTALSNLTKYTSIAFFVLVLALSFLNN